MYYINLQLTEKGTKVCGSPTKTLEMPWDKYLEPTDDDLNEFWRAGGSSEQVIEKWNLLYKMIMD